MKRLAGIFLIICFVLPFAGSYCWLQIKKQKVRKEIKWKMIAGIDRNELVLLKFSKNDTSEKLRWKHSREFEYQGQMYDIVTKELKGDSTFFWCWWDHEETKLNKQLSALVNQVLGRNPENRQQQQQLADFMKLLFVEDTEDSSFKISEIAESKYHNLFFRYYSPFYIPISPPPEFL